MTRRPSPGEREILVGAGGLGSRELVGTPRLWLLASEGIGPRPPNCQPLLPRAIPDGSALAVVGVSLDGRKSYVGRTFRLACWNPTAWCAACRLDRVTVWRLAQREARRLAGSGRSTAGIKPGLAWCCSVCQVPPLGFPIGLCPSSPRQAP